jgi:hypothetical protein
MEKKKINLIAIIAVMIIAAGALAYATSTLTAGAKEPVVSVENGEVKIDALFGVTFPVSEIRDYQLIDKSMEEIGVGRRTNGYGGVGTTLLGHFESDALGKHLLFVESDAKPTLFIDRAGGAEDVYLSFRDSVKMQAVYDALAAAMPKG